MPEQKQMLSMATHTIESIGMMPDSLCISAANNALCRLIIKERFTDMRIRRVIGHQLYNMDKPDPYNETMTFRSVEGATKAQQNYGGQIRPVPVHVQEES